MRHGVTMQAKATRIVCFKEWMPTIIICGVKIMVKVNRSLHPMERAKLDNAQSGAVQNATNIEDLTNALLELGELFAEQDDALVELAELIEEV